MKQHVQKRTSTVLLDNLEIHMQVQLYTRMNLKHCKAWHLVAGGKRNQNLC